MGSLVCSPECGHTQTDLTLLPFQDGGLLLPVSTSLQCSQAHWADVPEELGCADLQRTPPASVSSLQVGSSNVSLGLRPYILFRPGAS